MSVVHEKDNHMVRTTNPAAKSIARRIESLLDDARPGIDDDPKLALAELMNELHGVIDALDALPILPPLLGGAPHDDDFEELDPEFVADPDVWPSSYDEDIDGFRWEPTFDGPLPLSVLAETAPTWSPSDQDWNDYAAYCESQGYGVDEHDLAAAGLAIG
jgi:hypothetical protein